MPEKGNVCVFILHRVGGATHVGNDLNISQRQSDLPSPQIFQSALGSATASAQLNRAILRAIGTNVPKEVFQFALDPAFYEDDNSGLDNAEPSEL